MHGNISFIMDLFLRTMRKRMLLILLLALALFFSGCGQTTNAPATSDSNSQPATEASEPVSLEVAAQGAASSPAFNDTRLYNLEKYSRIQPGQSYEAVQAIIGDPGENMVDNERLKQFQWNNDDGSMISVTFYDNEMTGKGQARLGPLLEGDQVVTKSLFDQLEEGMTLEEVTSIMGPGTERVFTLFDESLEQIIGWENSDGSEISVTAIDGVVTKLSEVMLK